MKRIHFFLALAIILDAGSITAANADSYKNHFASIMVKGKKIGQVHFTARHDDEGTLQELKTRASYSVLGVEVYHHSLHTHEFWEAGEMKRLWGNANEHGKTYALDLTRTPEHYVGTINQQAMELPPNTFPTAVWHYAITEHSTLFSIPELRLLQVKVKKSKDIVTIGNREIPAEKFEFSGDWKSTVWFNYEKEFLKWQYKVKGRTVAVQLDP